MMNTEKTIVEQLDEMIKEDERKREAAYQLITQLFLDGRITVEEFHILFEI